MDNELRDMLLSIQQNISKFQNDVNDKFSVINRKLSDLEAKLSEVDKRVSKIEITLENETNKKIDVLFEGRIDEIRNRKENIETSVKVAILEMKVDSWEKASRVS